jgi:hypothetical protein
MAPIPLRWISEAADRFEQRGVYVPGEHEREVNLWREFGWAFIAWIFMLGLFVLFFTLAT